MFTRLTLSFFSAFYIHMTVFMVFSNSFVLLCDLPQYLNNILVSVSIVLRFKVAKLLAIAINRKSIIRFKVKITNVKRFAIVRTCPINFTTQLIACHLEIAHLNKLKNLFKLMQPKEFIYLNPCFSNTFIHWGLSQSHLQVCVKFCFITNDSLECNLIILVSKSLCNFILTQPLRQVVLTATFQTQT